MKVPDRYIANHRGLPVLTKKGNPVKRCQRMAPMHGDLQCEKWRKHNKTDQTIVHKNGLLTWHDAPAHEAMRVFLDQWRVGVPRTFDPKLVTYSTGDTVRASDFEQDITTFGDTGQVRGLLNPNKARGASPTFVAIDEMQGAQVASEEARKFERSRTIPLDEWWRSVSEKEISDTVPKAIEYGATDLIDIGSQLGRFMKRDLSNQEAAELGCWFYLVGKMARATSALERGDWPSDDTIKDAGIYLKMIQRIRQAGSWPGEDLFDNEGEESDDLFD